MSIQKSVIAPIVATLLLVVGNITGHPFSQALDGQITDVIFNAISIYVVVAGIIKNHQIEKKQEAQALPLQQTPQAPPAPVAPVVPTAPAVVQQAVPPIA